MTSKKQIVPCRLGAPPLMNKSSFDNLLLWPVNIVDKPMGRLWSACGQVASFLLSLCWRLVHMLSIAALSHGNYPHINRPYLKRAFIQMAALPAGRVLSLKYAPFHLQAIIKLIISAHKNQSYLLIFSHYSRTAAFKAGLYAHLYSQVVRFSGRHRPVGLF